MNKVLFKTTFKASWLLGLGFTGFVLIYVLVSISMFDPTNPGMMEAMLEMLPEGMVKAFGFDQISGGLTTYLSNFLYGIILLVFPLIYGVMIANNLVAKHVDKGSMAYLLTTPNTRKKIISTQFIYMVLSIIGIFVISVAVSIALCQIMFSGQLDIGGFLSLNIVTVLVTIVMASICFGISCIFNESRTSLLLGTLISLFSLIMHMLSSLGEKTENLKYFSLHSLVDIDKSLNDGGYVLVVSIILILVTVVIYMISLKIFDKRNLII